MRRLWIGLLFCTSLAAAQQAPRVWTIQELFTRNVGSTDQQNKQFPPHKIIGSRGTARPTWGRSASGAVVGGIKI